jgi:hypothetical protein
MTKFAVNLKHGLDVDDTEIIEASNANMALVIAGMDMLRAVLYDNPRQALNMEAVMDELRDGFTVTATAV